MRSSTEVTPVVPAGWKLVPIEPTEEMKVAGCDHDDPLGRLVDWQGKDVTTREVVAGVFGAMIAAAPTPIDHAEPFQARVQPWLMACFGEVIAGDREERNHRFLEEALELVQSTGCTVHEAHQLVDYVFGRAVGEPHQEVGGVMVTLAALCWANDLDMHQCGETELSRIWTKIEAIRAKQAAKPKHSPLPGPTVCGLPDPTTRDCPNMQEVGGGMDGERYRCAVCGKGYFLDYEEMR